MYLCKFFENMKVDSVCKTFRLPQDRHSKMVSTSPLPFQGLKTKLPFNERIK